LQKAKPGAKLLWWRRTGGQKDNEPKRFVNQQSHRYNWEGVDDRTERRDQRMAANYAQRNAGQHSGEISSQGLNTSPPPGSNTFMHGITPIHELPEHGGDGDSDNVIVSNKSSEGSGSNSCRPHAGESNRPWPLSKATSGKPAEGEQGKQAGNANDSSWSDLVESFAQKKGLFKGWFRKRSKAQYGVDRKYFSIDVNPTNCLGNVSPTFGRIADEFDAQIPVGQLVKRDPGDWSYLQRALRIKPEVKIIVMSHARPVARSILCSILVNEGSSGIADLVRDSENRFSFTGRVEKDNST
jgi:hypothetical protein